ncbi:MFS transporter [Bremerella cremea]|uniref:MFS transporter n=1 Tax=Bremerella cremea TaxID=1031537 RepID=A0A368KKN9_9BACT|nr:MFS transporter [Bremerella cremea]RCS41338.1 MFS transporter [Bremerella cremea]
MNSNSRSSTSIELAKSASATSKQVAPTQVEGVSRNFFLLTLQQIVLRCGWIFKTESIIIPAVLDLIAGSGWVRGFLPILGRIGQSCPPLLYADRLRHLPLKKWSLVGTSLGMAAAFGSLAAMFIPGVDTAIGKTAMVVGFLWFYFLFFCATGLNQLGFGTAQGKLIPPPLRGRLMLASNVVGAVIATSLAAWLLPKWLYGNTIEVHWIFGFAAFAFMGSALSVVGLHENRDSSQASAFSPKRLIWQSYRVLQDDHRFRLVCIIAAAFGFSLMLFPHYQALARDRLDVDLSRMIFWVIVQNAGTAIFSLLGGPLADWKGNRLVLRMMLFGVMILPLGSIFLVHSGEFGIRVFDWLFLFVGITPITFRAFTNYTLELVPAELHPRYLATQSLCIALPMVLSPLIGLLIDLTSFEAVFMGVTVILFGGWVMTYYLVEPRHEPGHHIAYGEMDVDPDDEV